MNDANEFRVFICSNRITAISQYKWHTDCGWHSAPKSTFIPHVVSGIHRLWTQLRPFLDFDSCVFDVHVLFNDDDSITVELVEFNSFGAHLGSGSALFEWARDFDLLNDLVPNAPVVIRFTH